VAAEAGRELALLAKLESLPESLPNHAILVLIVLQFIALVGCGLAWYCQRTPCTIWPSIWPWRRAQGLSRPLLPPAQGRLETDEATLRDRLQTTKEALWNTFEDSKNGVLAEFKIQSLEEELEATQATLSQAQADLLAAKEELYAERMTPRAATGPRASLSQSTSTGTSSDENLTPTTSGARNQVRSREFRREFRYLPILSPSPPRATRTLACSAPMFGRSWGKGCLQATNNPPKACEVLSAPTSGGIRPQSLHSMFRLFSGREAHRKRLAEMGSAFKLP